MPCLFIMQGPPGSGKSSIAHSIRDSLSEWSENEVVIASADHYMVDEDGIYRFNKDKLPEAHKKCFEDVVDAVRRERDVIVDNTNIYKQHVEPYIELASQAGYDVQVIRCYGRFKSVHDVPENVVERMRHDMQELI